MGKGKEDNSTAQHGVNQFPDVNSTTAEVISRGAVIRIYCAPPHRYRLGMAVLYGELERCWVVPGNDDVRTEAIPSNGGFGRLGGLQWEMFERSLAVNEVIVDVMIGITSTTVGWRREG